MDATTSRSTGAGGEQSADEREDQMNKKMFFGLLLLVGSYAQLLFPRRLFSDPAYFLHGYPIVPGTVLGTAAALFNLGIIVFSEGVCQRFGAPSLWRLATRDMRASVRFALAATAAGLVMEFFAQWLGKLWIYPYWTPWLYWVALLPGFAFYWASIVESYLAAKAALDAVAKLQGKSNMHGFESLLYSVLGAVGAALLLVVAWLYGRWYVAHGGYVFAATVPQQYAPPFAYVLLAFLGAWFVVEWGLHRRRLPSLVTSLLQGYWVPAVAVAGSSLLLSFIMESQNAVNRYWVYTHLPGRHMTFFGVQLSIFAAWPLQYFGLLLLPSVFVPSLAHLFWRRHGETSTTDRDGDVDADRW